MTTIDEELFKIVQSRMSQAYEDLSDPDQWTRESRDAMVAKSRNLNLQLSDEGVTMVEQLLKQEINGKSVMYWLILRGVLMGELELFVASRSQIDTATDEQLADSPFDHSWLTEQIRVRYKELADLDVLLEPYTPDSVEEI